MDEGPWLPSAKDVIDFADVEQDHFVLDVGSGFGDLSEELIARGAEVVSLDFSHKYLRNVADKVKGGNPVLADATFMPFKRSVFDRVVSKSVWHNIVQPYARERFILELGSVTKPGGLVVVSGLWNKLYCYLNPKRLLLNPPVDDRTHHYFMPSEVKSLLRKATLRIVDVRASKMLFRNTLPVVDRFLSPWFYAFYLDIKASKRLHGNGRY